MAAPTLQVHAKAWTAAAGTIFNLIVFIVQQVSPFLPPQWSVIVSGFLGLLTVFGVYKVPNKPVAQPTAGSPWPSA